MLADRRISLQKKIFIPMVFIIFAWASTAWTANLIYRIDFESDGWESKFAGEWRNYSKRVTTNPHGGQYSLRGNLMEGRIDPITGLPGNNSPKLDIVISDKTPHGVFIRYWRRFDDANWSGSESGHGKNDYLVDDTVGTGAYFTAMRWETGLFKVQGNGGYPQEWDQKHWGGLYAALKSPEPSAYRGNADGQWHKFEFYINYDEHFMQVWVDGQRLEATGNSVGYIMDGKVPLYPDFHLSALGFLYVHEAQVENSSDRTGYACGWQIDDIEVWDGLPDDMQGGESPGDNPPSVSITNPTSGDSYSTSEGSISISGNASDDNGISSITWSNNRGGSGSAVNSSGDWSDWSISGINLQEGENVITVIATDTNNQTATDTINVNYVAGSGEQMWSATSQTGDSQWKDSSVTYCVRLLIKGSNIPTSGNQVRLAFQGRSSGSYSIHNVSIAERDTNAPEGDVIDSTWTRVTFDGKAWNSETTVAAGSEKISDPVYINFKPGSDYYVTFKIDTPSVYLNPPSDYRELYFYNEDHSTDIDWSGNGHSTTQDYHALSKIYVIGNSSDTTPPGDVTDFNADPGPGKVTLSWTNPSDSDFAGVMIRYKTDGTFPQNYTDGMAVPNGNNGRIAGQPNAQGSYVHSGLDSNLTYYYSIFTYDTTGNYSHTAHASATPLPVGGSNQAPAISGFSAAPNPANNPHKKITFTVTASDSDGDPLSYKINFGDGTSSSSGSTVTHAYNTKGTYNVTATVSDNHGHSVSKTLQVVVNDNKPVKVTGVQAK